MSKRLTKTIWYGSGVDSNGNPILPSNNGGLDGLNYGELYLHLSNGKASLWTLSLDGKIVEITGGGSEVDMSSYLLKSIWDKVFEIRTDSQETEYIFGKLPMVTQYGITMYSGDGVDIPSLASGLPFDGRTIWYNPDTQQIEVIGGTGGGSGEGVSNFWDLSGIPSWITNSKPKYTYSEIEGTPDLSGFATQNWIISQGYASAEELKKYIPISGYTEVSGEKNFTGGLKVNGSPIYYDTEKKYWKLEGDLLVTGGVTMYGSDSSFTPSTIMDAILYDSATLGINSNGQLYVKGGTSGGGLDITALQNYLTSNSYLNVTSGDNRYLQLSGGTITGPLEIKCGADNKIVINNTDGEGYSRIVFQENGSYIGQLLSTKDGNIHWGESKIWHSGNDGSGSGLNADLLDGQQGSWYQGNIHSFERVNYTSSLVHDANVAINGMLFNYGSNTYWRNTPDMSYGQILTLKSYGNNELMGQLAWDIRHGENDTTRYLWWRAIQNESTISNAKWHQIAFTDSNVASATKLQTARTIWGQSFDGTGNVSGVISNTHTIEFDTLLGAANIGYLWTNTRGMHMDMSGLGTEQQGTNLTLTPTGNVGIGTANPSYKLHVAGSGYFESYLSIGTASTASLSMNRTSANYITTPSGGYIVFCMGGNATSVGGSNLALYTHNVAMAMSGGNVGIGTASPSAKLHIVNNANTSTGLLLDGGWSGYGFLYNGINIFLNGESYGGIGVNTVSSAYGSTSTAGTYITNAKSGEYMNFYNEGGVFLKANLLVNGVITMYSDQRKKTILKHVELSLKQISEAPLIEHYYNGDEKKTTHVGSIAQYWANMNDWFCKLDSEGYYTMEIQNAALASAISIARELDRYETKTDKAIKKLKKRISELEDEVERLKCA